jgi:UrcA family protein
MTYTTKSVRCLTGIGAFSLLLAAAPAAARDYDRYADDAYARNDSREQVEITAPRYHRERSATTGAPLRTVSLSREVRADDLDLSTRWGARELRARIRHTASTLCNRLDVRYPVTAQDSPSCYRTAVADAMDHADEVIASARE